MTPEPGISTTEWARLRLGDGIRSVLSNGAHFMGVQWIETVLGAVYFAVMARSLGPAFYGQWAYGIAAYALVLGLAGFGLDALILLRLGRDRESAADFVGLTLTLRLACLGLGAAGLAVYALAAESDALSRLVLLLFVPALLGRGVALWARISFLAYERMGDYLQIAVLLRSAEAGCGIAYLLAGGGLVGVVVLHSLLWIGEALFGLWRIRSRLTRFAPRFAWQPARALLAQGAVLGVAGAAYTWLVSGPIMLLRDNGVSMAQVGQFAIVASLTMILVGSAHAFFTAALPVLSRSTRRHQAGLGYGRLTALAFAATAVAAAGAGWLLGPPVAVWVLGPRYAVAGGLLAPFLVIGGLVLMPTGYDQSLLLAGRRCPGALANIAAGICLAAVFPLAVSAWGLSGAVIATAGAWLVRAAVLVAVGEVQCARRPRAAAEIAIAGGPEKTCDDGRSF